MAVTARMGSVTEAAATYGVAESTIRLWIRTGKLEATRVGQRRYLVNLDAPSHDPHIAFTRALQSITPDDVRDLREFAARLDAAVEGSGLLFSYAWSAIGAEARRRALEVA